MAEKDIKRRSKTVQVSEVSSSRCLATNSALRRRQLAGACRRILGDKAPKYTVEEQMEIIRTRGKFDRDLLHSYGPLIVRLASNFYVPQYMADDMFMDGVEGYYKSIARYDVDKGFAPSTYLVRGINFHIMKIHSGNYLGYGIKTPKDRCDVWSKDEHAQFIRDGEWFSITEHNIEQLDSYSSSPEHVDELFDLMLSVDEMVEPGQDKPHWQLQKPEREDWKAAVHILKTEGIILG